MNSGQNEYVQKKWNMYKLVCILVHILSNTLIVPSWKSKIIANNCFLLQNGLTALHYATGNYHPETCEVLLKNNANKAKTRVSMLKRGVNIYDPNELLDTCRALVLFGRLV